MTAERPQIHNSSPSCLKLYTKFGANPSTTSKEKGGDTKNVTDVEP